MSDESHSIRIDAYLDGLLSADERAALEAEVLIHALFRAEIDLQRRVDDVLRREFAPPVDMPSLWTNGQTLPAGRLSLARPSPLPRLRAWGLAAMMALAVTAALYVALTTPPAVTPIALKRDSLVDVRERLLSRGFEPEWVCKVGPKFAMSVYWRLGQPLLLSAIPEGVDVLGWSYCNALSPETMVLLCRVEGQPVVVFVDRTENDAPQAGAEGELRLFRRELGELVLYELSQTPSEQVLPLFYEPRIEEGWMDISVYED